MKQILSILFLILVVATFASAQSQIVFPAQFAVDDAQLVKTFSNYTATSDDSTAYLTLSTTVLGTKVGSAREIYLIGVSTDSVAADVTLRLRNASLTGLTTTYADSMVSTSNTGAYRVITIKDMASVNRLTAYNQFKIITEFRASANGTTTGRTMKWYLWYVL